MEIGQFFESALRNQREELKQAALQAVAQMGGAATVTELLASDAGQGIRQLSLRDLRDALPDLEVESRVQSRVHSKAEPADVIDDEDDGLGIFEDDVGDADEASQQVSDAERIYREILEALAQGPQTIGQIAKGIDSEVDGTELRAYLAWMRQMGKIYATGRARATRYQLPDQ